MFNRGAWRWHSRATGEEAGRLHQLGANSLKATCKRHGHSCCCIISIPAAGSARQLAMGRVCTKLDVEKDLANCFAYGLDMSEEHHQAAARSLKRDVYKLRAR